MFHRPAPVSHSVRCGAFLLAAAFAACSAPMGPSDPEPGALPPPASAPDSTLATIALSLSAVPADVRCVRLQLTGYEMVLRTVDVSPGSLGQVINFPALPLGPATVFFDTFNAACGSVVANTGPTWVAIQPAVLELLGGKVAPVSVDLRRPTSIDGSLDFADSPKGVFIEPQRATMTGLIGQRPGAQFFNLRNTSSALFPVPPFSITGDQDFRVATDTCHERPLAPGTSCFFGVEFEPKFGESKQAVLKAGGLFATISAVVVDPRAVLFSPTSVNFGNVALGSRSTETLTLQNGMSVPLGPLTIQVTTDRRDFEVTDTSCRGDLAPGATCTVVVQFAPSTNGQKSGRLIVNGVSAELTGLTTGLGSVTVTADQENLGEVILGNHTVTRLTVSNTTVTPFPLTLESRGSSDFHIDFNNCPAVLLPDTSCDLFVLFAPTSTFGFARISAGPGSEEALLTANVRVPRLTYTPAPFDFGKVSVGLSARQLFTVTTDTTINIQPAVRNASDFQVISGGTCGTVLAAGGACTIQVAFAPRSGGPQTASLQVGDLLDKLPISGTGGGVSLVPTNVKFGSVAVGESASATLTLTNDSAAEFAPMKAFTAFNPDEFQFGVGTCGSIVPAGGSCTIVVRFSPVTTGLRTAGLTVGGRVANASLSGTGVAGSVSVSPSSLDFGTVTVGNSSAQTITVTNGSGAAIATTTSFFPLGIFDADPAAGTCRGASLATGASCTIVVRFTPQGAGVTSGVLTIGASVATVALAGVAVMPAALVSNLLVNDSSLGNDGIPNNQQWSVQPKFAAGVTPFADRTFTIGSTGSTSMDGLTWIRTTADSKSFASSPVATFKSAGSVLLIVADNRHNGTSGKPAFLDATYNEMGFDITVMEGTTPRAYSVWRKSIAIGATVSLPAVNSSLAPGYFVLVN
jgi:hypothetical protein